MPSLLVSNESYLFEELHFHQVADVFFQSRTDVVQILGRKIWNKVSLNKDRLMNRSPDQPWDHDSHIACQCTQGCEHCCSIAGLQIFPGLVWHPPNDSFRKGSAVEDKSSKGSTGKKVPLPGPRNMFFQTYPPDFRDSRPRHAYKYPNCCAATASAQPRFGASQQLVTNKRQLNLSSSRFESAD